MKKKKTKIQEFIPCPKCKNVKFAYGKGTYMRWDEDDAEYSCNSCGSTRKLKEAANTSCN